MESESPAVRSLRRVLLETRTRHAIIGGAAVVKYGKPRATVDLDVLAEVRGPRHLSELLQKFSAEKFKTEAVTEKTVKVQKGGLPVEIVAATGPFEKQVLSRATTRRLLGVHLKFATPEDVVILKAVRASPLDIEDIRGICAGRKLDRNYLFRESKKVGPNTHRVVVGTCGLRRRT